MSVVTGSAPISGDAAQISLVRHLAATQTSLRSYLRSIDPKADCVVVPAADLGPPYDVLRLWGGFATGCFIEWSCRTPVIPIDVTMNVDTTSVFVLSQDPGPILEANAVAAARRTIVNESSYLWNFESGNHFMSVTECDGEWALVLHSNEKEFKDQYNGLSPRADNWYGSRVHVIPGPRPLRIITGDDAVTFAEIAEMLVPYNRLRHRQIAQLILSGSAAIVDEWHKEHYYMPTASSVAIGAFVCEPEEDVLVFSTVGRPLMWFRPAPGGENMVERIGGGQSLIVPHGWGMTADPFDIRVEPNGLVLNGVSTEPTPGATLFDGFGVHPRIFSDNRTFVSAVARHTPGQIIREMRQVQSHSRHGSLSHAHI